MKKLCQIIELNNIWRRILTWGTNIYKTYELVQDKIYIWAKTDNRIYARFV